MRQWGTHICDKHMYRQTNRRTREETWFYTRCPAVAVPGHRCGFPRGRDDRGRPGGARGEQPLYSGYRRYHIQVGLLYTRLIVWVFGTSCEASMFDCLSVGSFLCSYILLWWLEIDSQVFKWWLLCLPGWASEYNINWEERNQCNTISPLFQYWKLTSESVAEGYPQRSVLCTI